MIGMFDRNKKWKYEMEKTIFSRLNLKYDMKNVNKKYYRMYVVAPVCCQTKVEYIKKINKAITGGHNRKLGNTRPDLIIKE
jgi:hypothetical protein